MSIIDVHHHFVPPALLEAHAERIAREVAQMGASPLASWSPERSIEEMDRNDVAIAISSISPPGVWTGDAASARKLARDCNDYTAEVVREHPGRFGFFAALPLPDVDGTLAEIAYALDTLGADGIGILSSANDVWPGDATLQPVMEELDRRGAVVYVHATVPGCCERMLPGVPPPVTEFLFDTTRAISSLLLNGTFTRYPKIRFIFSHGGGAIAMLAARVSTFASRMPWGAERLPNGAGPELVRMFYDLATTTSAPALTAIKAMVPSTQLLFGSDFPFVPIAATGHALPHAGFSDDELRGITSANARTLLPKFASTSS